MSAGTWRPVCARPANFPGSSSCSSKTTSHRRTPKTTPSASRWPPTTTPNDWSRALAGAPRRSCSGNLGRALPDGAGARSSCATCYVESQLSRLRTRRRLASDEAAGGPHRQQRGGPASGARIAAEPDVHGVARSRRHGACRRVGAGVSRSSDRRTRIGRSGRLGMTAAATGGADEPVGSAGRARTGSEPGLQPCWVPCVDLVEQQLASLHDQGAQL